MADAKVRCPACGAKNSDPLAERCRICGGMLPNANARRAARIGATTDGPSFDELVENEVTAWREYAAGRGRPMSRRPEEIDEPPKRGLFRRR
jgi:hypothetical protein